MGQPGHGGVRSGNSGFSTTQSFLDCDMCHNNVPRYDTFDNRPKANTCKFFGDKNKVGLIGPNGCETYKPKL